MRLLVTGGAGFIGSAFCRHVIGTTSAEILNVDKLTYAANLVSLASVADNPRYRLSRTDINDRAALDRLFAEFRPDAVVHLAAESHVDRSIDGSTDFIRTNINGTHALLEASRAHHAALAPGRRDTFRFLHVSTDEVFGSLGPNGSFSESTAYAPTSPYSASKAASDHLARAWHHTYGLPVIVSNCSNNYGPFQFPEKLIPLTIINALEGKPLPVYGNGSNVRDWLFVDDHVRALVTMLERGEPGQTYTVGGAGERTNLDMVERICDLVDAARPTTVKRRSLITFVTDRPGHDLRYAIDCSKLSSKLGWKPNENLEGGLRKTVEWYLDSEEWWRPIRDRVYNGVRLGLGGRVERQQACDRSDRIS